MKHEWSTNISVVVVSAALNLTSSFSFNSLSPKCLMYFFLLSKKFYKYRDPSSFKALSIKLNKTDLNKTLFSFILTLFIPENPFLWKKLINLIVSWTLFQQIIFPHWITRDIQQFLPMNGKIIQMHMQN